MKSIFIILIMLGCLHAYAQPPNNAIFGGGNNDGFNKTIFKQTENNIYLGGNGDGFNKTAFTQAENNIYKGGNGDGFDKTAFAQAVNNIYNGGSGDGFDKTAFAQAANNIYNGGSGDGFDKTAFAQAQNNIYSGGQGDGFNNTTFAQAQNNIYGGGEGDGWTSVYRPQGPLPLTLLYFEAKKLTATTAVLHWKTSQEINTYKFEIERSTDAIFFYKIGTAKAAGFSSTATEYSFIDKNTVNGMNFYRLKQIDIDGKFIYSPTRLVKFDQVEATDIQFYPNPTIDFVNIKLNTITNEPKVINIINTKGEVVNQIKITNNNSSLFTIYMGKYAKGVYLIQVKSATINTTQRIILH